MSNEFDAGDHWEALFDAQYMRWYHLKGCPALVEITKVERDVEMTLPGGRKVKRPVVHLKQVSGKIEEIKPLVLNKTNGQSIRAIAGDKPKGWPGKRIVLLQDKTMCSGEMKPCIRVRKPKA